MFLFWSIVYPFTAFTRTQPDSAYVFAYAQTKDGGRNGLHFAWSIDKQTWHQIGQEYSFLRCDYGRWRAQKRMVAPFLYHALDGLWHAVWAVNESDGVFAHAASPDLVHWQRQSYPPILEKGNCLTPTLSFDKNQQHYTISWISQNGTKEQVYAVTTADFKEYSRAQPIEKFIDDRQELFINNRKETGKVHRVAWSIVDGLIKTQQLTTYKESLWAERATNDDTRFSELKSIEAKITLDAANQKKISDLLLGAFFEDINYAADGGLYAELIQNRDFEYALSDKEGKDKNWDATMAWTTTDKSAQLQIDSLSPIHINNKHYALLQVNQVGSGLINEGFDGIAIQAQEAYNFTVFARTSKGKAGKLRIRLKGKDGTIYAEGQTDPIDHAWKKYEVTLRAKQTAADLQLEILPQTAGTTALDMVSLFPVNTFKGRKNGLRRDLAQAIADIHPRFIRFPGGCVAHGDGLENMYRWKQTIGPLEVRKPQRNLWGYHQTAGLGYFEYFQFCEDIGAEPIPVVAAGVPCQNSDTGGAGQQGGFRWMKWMLIFKKCWI
ncbi:hypothetical protein GCM10023231_25220 [Olivibacter ginsenosidimutans]|uniref:Alpha-L-arabinofuranosidase n=1 Tax=Olivibacter ginsenosidimutans TaxID=1176537 RepID=A0ABP9BI43_9SPHI